MDKASKRSSPAHQDGDAFVVVTSTRGKVSLDDYYETEEVCRRVVRRIVDTSSSSLSSPTSPFSCRVALQFPDELLPDADRVSWSLEEALTAALRKPPLVFVSGDTSHGACCVDEVAAAHLNADVIVHYGRACLSPTSGRTAVVHVFGRSERRGLDPELCAEDVSREMTDRRYGESCVLLLYEPSYRHAAQEIADRLRRKGWVVVVGTLPVDDLDRCRPCNDDDEGSSIVAVGGLRAVLPPGRSLSDFVLLYVTDRHALPINRRTLNVLFRCDEAKDRWICDASGRISTTLPDAVHRETARRFYLIQKARRAATVGVVVATLGVAHFRRVVDYLIQILRENGRSAYVLVVGKINVAKLANFGEMECFVVVACPERSVLDDRDFHVPVITPWEMEVALDRRDWTGCMESDFGRLLMNDKGEGQKDKKKKEKVAQRRSNPRAQENDENSRDDYDDAPYFSLVSGGYEQNLNKHWSNELLNLATAPGKGQLTVHDSSATRFLSQREYQGLKSDIGKTEVKAAAQGQTGIASDYGNR